MKHCRTNYSGSTRDSENISFAPVAQEDLIYTQYVVKFRMYTASCCSLLSTPVSGGALLRVYTCIVRVSFLSTAIKSPKGLSCTHHDKRIESQCLFVGEESERSKSLILGFCLYISLIASRQTTTYLLGPVTVNKCENMAQ